VLRPSVKFFAIFARILTAANTRLQLPNNLELFTQRVLIHRGEADEVSQGEARCNRVAIHLRNDPMSPADFDQLARFGNGRETDR
jgi:hypothetical protein